MCMFTILRAFSYHLLALTRGNPRDCEYSYNLFALLSTMLRLQKEPTQCRRSIKLHSPIDKKAYIRTAYLLIDDM